MSILETFYILFKGDNTDVKKKAKETEYAAQTLHDALTGQFRKIDIESKKVGKSFGELARAAAQLVGVSAAAYTVFHRTLAATELAGQLGRTAQVLRINVSELDAWSQAAKLAGGSAEGFISSLRNLSKHFGTSGATTLKILPKLADIFQRLGSYRAQYYGNLLGLDESTILFLQQGRREVEGIIRRVKELGVITEKNVEISTKFKVAQLELSLAFRSLYLELGSTVVPILTEIYKLITPIIEYIAKHKDLVIGAFIGIGIAAAAMLSPFIIAAAPILGTIALISALIGLFALAYEDILFYIRGHGSFTGDLIKRWSNVKTVMTDVLTVIRKLLEWAFAPLFPAIRALGLLENLHLNPFTTESFKNSLEKTKAFLGLSNEAPIATAGANRFTSQQFARNASINTGDIIIQTQATDAEGIAKDFSKDLLSKHLWQANNYFSNGNAY